MTSPDVMIQKECWEEFLGDLSLMFIDECREHRVRLLTPYSPICTLRGTKSLVHLRRLSRLANFKTDE